MLIIPSYWRCNGEQVDALVAKLIASAAFVPDGANDYSRHAFRNVCGWGVARKASYDPIVGMDGLCIEVICPWTAAKCRPITFSVLPPSRADSKPGDMVRVSARGYLCAP